MLQIIKGYNKKIVQKETQETLDCDCRVKKDCTSMVIAEIKV